MKFREFMRLQLFADDPAPADPAPQDPKPDTPAAPKPADQTPSNPAPSPKYTDDDVDKILSRKFAEWQKKKDKEMTEAQKLAQMDATQKAEYKAQQFEKELNELKEKNILSEMSKTARKMLAEEEINIPDELLERLVSVDAAQTKASVESFTKLFKGAVNEAVKNALKGPAPKAGIGGKTTATKEQIMAIKNPSERQRMIAENITLFQ
ncbi:DUF4355 domain-containing protein [Lachnospiraceae bacterium OF09-33XD]|nr:DUF4355 domain-containing protein [Lachnospiraceae bacterium OF09-33XD]